MRRTKEWWARLTKEEREALVWLDKANRDYGSSSYLPEPYGFCGCGTPTNGGGICSECSDDRERLIQKANGEDIPRAALSVAR